MTKPPDADGVIRNPDHGQVEIARMLASATRDESEAKFFAACKDQQEAEARKTNAEAALQELFLSEKLIFRQRELTKDKYHHRYRFTESIDDKSVRACIDELTVWSRTAPGCDIELVLNTPGGAVFPGTHLMDFLLELQDMGHHVTTRAMGICASMGAILLQAGSRREAGKDAIILIHEMSTLTLGKIGEIEDDVALIHKVQDRQLDTLARRSAEAKRNGTAEIALTRDQFENGDKSLGVPGWARRDWTLDSDEAVKFGIVDAVR